MIHEWKTIELDNGKYLHTCRRCGSEFSTIFDFKFLNYLVWLDGDDFRTTSEDCNEIIIKNLHKS